MGRSVAATVWGGSARPKAARMFAGRISPPRGRAPAGGSLTSTPIARTFSEKYVQVSSTT